MYFLTLEHMLISNVNAYIKVLRVNVMWKFTSLLKRGVFLVIRYTNCMTEKLMRSHIKIRNRTESLIILHYV